MNLLNGRFRDKQGRTHSVDRLLKDNAIQFAVLHMDFERKTTYKDMHGKEVYIGDTIKEISEAWGREVTRLHKVEEHPTDFSPVVKRINGDNSWWDDMEDMLPFGVVQEKEK